MKHYDLIVLGTGAIGGAAMFHATRRGLTTLGLDRFPPGHDRGSSHGESRLIRLSYIEHPDYVPMLRRSYALWDELDPGLLHRSGIAYIGPPQGATLQGVLASAREHDLLVETRPPEAFPHFKLPEGHGLVFEPDGGWLPVERCVETHIARAVAAGAEHRWGESILSWEETAHGVIVRTDVAEYRAARLIVAAGAWSDDLLKRLALPLTVQRKHLHWFECDDERYRTGFFFERDEGDFYGFPARNGRLKLAEHSGGETISDPLGASTEPDPEDSGRIDEFVRRCLPGVRGARVEHKTCFYTRTPDHHFILDHYPGSRRIAFAAGLSGHGFKFAPVLGEQLVQLVEDGETRLDTSFLSLSRFGLAEA
ncbi:MAG: N-methyl-L-tryptophan oxidase [Halieaceae bacterium]|nr:N-methyl-L-tryptophan oxidase [Halieaceae bacterium]